MNDDLYMQRCLFLAKQGLAEAAPNPSVGALLVHNNTILAEAYTSPFGGNHAEVNCIHQVEDKMLLAKATLYVSLEPCSHFGKTPPCSNLIIESGIKKVVIACSDPNPLVAGKGIKRLQKAGIEVLFGVLEQEAINLNKRFFTFHQKKRPFVTLKWAQTAQGFFAPEDNSQFWITSKKTKALVHQWRSLEMGILVGENTVIVDNPRLNVRLVAGKHPIRLIINTKKMLNENALVFNDDVPCYLFTTFQYSFQQKSVTQVKITPDKSIVIQVLDYLYQQNINSILVEGGAFTLQSFINENVWDEARVLTGNNELEKGIKAPLFNATFKHSFKIANDTVKIYSNT